MTAHELARLLLEGPDLPVIAPIGDGGGLEQVSDVYDYGQESWNHWWGTDGKYHNEPAIELG